MAAETVETFVFVGELGCTVTAFHVDYVGWADLFAAGTGAAFITVKMRSLNKNFFCKEIDPFRNHFAEGWRRVAHNLKACAAAFVFGSTKSLNLAGSF